MLEYLALFAIAIIALYLWFRDREKENQRRIDDCDHPAHMQKTMRVNSIMTMNAALIHAVLPGRRWMKKHCLSCGWQRGYYTRAQSWDEYQAEWKQETIDRVAEYKAREREHKLDVENEERIRKLKREKGLKKDGKGTTDA